MAIRRRPTKTPGEMTASAVCLVLGELHKVLALSFRFVGRCASAVIGVLPWPVRLAFLMLLLSAPMMLIGLWGRAWYLYSMDFTSELEEVVAETYVGVFKTFDQFAFAGRILAGGLIAAALIGFLRARFILRILRAIAALACVYWLILAGFLWYFPDSVATNFPKLLGGAEGAEQWRNELWVQWLWACVPGLVA